MTRARTSGASMGNIARARIANRAGAALFLRVHADGSSSPTARGTHTLTPALRRGWTDDVYGREPPRRGRSSRRELVRALGFPDRGIQERSDFTGFNWADVPVILVEMGFMTNPFEDRALATPTVRQRAAVGLCRGTLRFLGPSARALLRFGDYPLTTRTCNEYYSVHRAHANGRASSGSRRASRSSTWPSSCAASRRTIIAWTTSRIASTRMGR